MVEASVTRGNGRRWIPRVEIGLIPAGFLFPGPWLLLRTVWVVIGEMRERETVDDQIPISGWLFFSFDPG